MVCGLWNTPSKCKYRLIHGRKISITDWIQLLLDARKEEHCFGDKAASWNNRINGLIWGGEGTEIRYCMINRRKTSKYMGQLLSCQYLKVCQSVAEMTGQASSPWPVASSSEHVYSSCTSRRGHRCGEEERFVGLGPMLPAHDCFLRLTPTLHERTWQDVSALCHIWFKNSASKYRNGYLLRNSAGCAQLRRSATQLLVSPSIWVFVPLPPVFQCLII